MIRDDAQGGTLFFLVLLLLRDFSSIERVEFVQGCSFYSTYNIYTANRGKKISISTFISLFLEYLASFSFFFGLFFYACTFY